MPHTSHAEALFWRFATKGWGDIWGGHELPDFLGRDFDNATIVPDVNRSTGEATAFPCLSRAFANSAINGLNPFFGGTRFHLAIS